MVSFENASPSAAAKPAATSRRASASVRPSIAAQAMTGPLLPVAATQYQEIGLKAYRKSTCQQRVKPLRRQRTT